MSEALVAQIGGAPTRREELLPLLAMLDASPATLRRDECGDYRINGRRGHIYPWGDGGKTWWVYVVCRSARHWTATKKRLPFVTITQDGEEEGAGRMGLIDAEQAAIIREVCGIRRRTYLSPEERERRLALVAKAPRAQGRV